MEKLIVISDWCEGPTIFVTCSLAPAKSYNQFTVSCLCVLFPFLPHLNPTASYYNHSFCTWPRSLASLTWSYSTGKIPTPVKFKSWLTYSVLEPTLLNVGGENPAILLTNLTWNVWPLTSSGSVILLKHPFAPSFPYMTISCSLLPSGARYQFIASHLLDKYILQISTTSFTTFTLGRWPCFLFYSENKSNQKRTSIGPKNIPTYLDPATLLLLWVTWLYSELRPTPPFIHRLPSPHPYSNL